MVITKRSAQGLLEESNADPTIPVGASKEATLLKPPAKKAKPTVNSVRTDSAGVDSGSGRRAVIGQTTPLRKPRSLARPTNALCRPARRKEYHTIIVNGYHNGELTIPYQFWASLLLGVMLMMLGDLDGASMDSGQDGYHQW